MHITYNEMDRLPFKFFHKKALLKARPLTKNDYQERGGAVQTREGPVGFEPGDYLACGIESEEWPITKDHFATGYDRVSEPDAEGFAYYRAIAICQAHQMPEPFTARRKSGDMLTGK